MPLNALVMRWLVTLNSRRSDSSTISSTSSGASYPRATIWVAAVMSPRSIDVRFTMSV